jgi:hypothetical protein
VISVQAIVLSLESSQIRRNHNWLKSLSFFFSLAPRPDLVRLGHCAGDRLQILGIAAGQKPPEFREVEPALRSAARREGAATGDGG